MKEYVLLDVSSPEFWIGFLFGMVVACLLLLIKGGPR